MSGKSSLSDSALKAAIKKRLRQTPRNGVSTDTLVTFVRKQYSNTYTVEYGRVQYILGRLVSKGEIVRLDAGDYMLKK